MPESDKLLNPLEEIGSSLLNGGLLHQSFVRILDVENNELPYYYFRITPLLILSCSLLGFLQFKSGNDECARTCIIEIRHSVFLLDALVLLPGQLMLYFGKCNLYY
jgi:hypothetical protein